MCVFFSIIFLSFCIPADVSFNLVSFNDTVSPNNLLKFRYSLIINYKFVRILKQKMSENYKSQPSKRKRCPYCNSTNIGKLLFGLIRFDEEKIEKLEKQNIILAGCCVPYPTPTHACRVCKKQWIRKNNTDTLLNYYQLYINTHHWSPSEAEMHH